MGETECPGLRDNILSFLQAAQPYEWATGVLRLNAEARANLAVRKRQLTRAEKTAFSARRLCRLRGWAQQGVLSCYARDYGLAGESQAARATYPKSSSIGVARPKIVNSTCSRSCSVSTPVTVPEYEANGPSLT